MISAAVTVENKLFTGNGQADYVAFQASKGIPVGDYHPGYGRMIKTDFSFG